MRRTAVIVVLTGLIAGCSATVDKGSVIAVPGPTESTQVTTVDIPRDESLPTYVVVVQPLEIGTDTRAASAIPSPRRGLRSFFWIPAPDEPAGEGYNPYPAGMSEKVGEGIATQLISALSGAGNLSVVDYEHYRRHTTNPGVLLESGEVGPFLIKGAVTEFTEVAEADSNRKGAALGWAGTVLGIAGGLGGSSIASITGAGLSAANPTFEKTTLRRTGVVALDLQIVSPATGRIVGAFPASGRFTAETARSGVSVFGIGGGQAAFAQSALGQATRAAMNEAVRKTMETLAGRQSNRRSVQAKLPTL